MRRPSQTDNATTAAHREGGFSIVEHVLASAVVLIVAALAVSPVRSLITRGHLLSSVDQISILMRQARHEAISRGIPVVVSVDITAGELVAFADLFDATAGGPGSDLVFDPQPKAPEGKTDYEVGRLTLDPAIFFGGPPDDPDPVSGFGGTHSLIVFEGDGSVEDAGAIRLADAHENYLELRIASQASARLELRKWLDDDGMQTASFRSREEEGVRWEWNP